MKTEDVLKENARAVQTANRRNSLLYDGMINEVARAFLKDASLSDPTQTYKTILGDSLCTPEFAKYCVCVCDEDHGMSAIDFLPESVVVASDLQTAHIAYQQNYHSDRAYSLFFRTVQYEVQAIYRPTTVSVCEEVYYGRCTHCILPIYSSTDGIFPTIAKLMDKYDLIINAACDVVMPDGDSVMRFALLSHELSLPSSNTCYVQFNAVLPQSISLATFLLSCETVGASVAEMITLPLAYTMDKVSYTIRLHISHKNLTALLMFLHSVLDNYSLEGIFQIIQ